jgi:hypothetical protein
MELETPKRKEMGEKDKCEPVTEPASEPVSTGELPRQKGKKVQVDYSPSPPPPPKDQKIHPRQKIPPVPEGEKVPDKTPSSPVDLD